MFDPLYRIRQLLRATHAAPLTADEQSRVRAVLDDAAFALYQTMPPGDQRHTLEILDALVAQGQRAHPLLQAALLHDVAKRRVGLGYRTGVVVLNRLSPRLLPHLASPHPQSWRYPFYLSLHHSQLGAELAAQAGVNEPALTLIRAHQAIAPAFQGDDAPALTQWHLALKSFDDVN